MCKKNIDIPLSLCLFFPHSLYLASLVVWWLPLVGTSSLILLLLALLPTFLSYTCLSACLSRSPPFLFVSLYLYIRSLLIASYFFSILFHFISIFSSLLVLRSLLLNKPLLYLCTYLSEWETKDRKRQKEEGLYLLYYYYYYFFFFHLFTLFKETKRFIWLVT